MAKRHKPKFVLASYKHIMIGGKKRASIGFDSKEDLIKFVKKRKLKSVLVLKRKGGE